MRYIKLMLSALLISLFLTSASFQQNTDGKEVYEKFCQTCHKSEGRIKLRKSKLSEDAVESKIRNGKGKMPAFQAILNQKEIMAVKFYVISLRNK